MSQKPSHWSDYSVTDHRSGTHILERTMEEQTEYLDECRGRRRLLLLSLIAWGLAGLAAAAFFSL